MKKILALLLTATMVLGLAACGGNSQEEEVSQETNAETEAEAETASEPEESAESTEEANEGAQAETGLLERPEGYPSKAIEWIVPTAAGAAMDLPTRVLAELVDLGDAIAVVNQAGGTGTIGAQAGFEAEPDGTTLLTMGNGGVMIMPTLQELPYSADDFRHLSMIAPADPMTIAVKADSPYQTYEELEEALKAGEALTYSGGNPNGASDMAGNLWLQTIGVEGLTNVPYTGSAEAIAALLGGHVDFLVVDNSVVTARVEDGTMRVLALMGSERLPSMQDVPTLKELGVDTEYYGWKWLMVRKDVPEDIAEYIKQQVDLAIASDEYQEYMMQNFGAPVELVTEEEMTEIVHDNIETNKMLVETLGLTAG